MSWLTKAVRKVGKVAESAAKGAVRTVSGPAGKLVTRALKTAVVAGATTYGGPVASGLAARVVR